MLIKCTWRGGCELTIAFPGSFVLKGRTRTTLKTQPLQIKQSVIRLFNQPVAFEYLLTM